MVRAVRNTLGSTSLAAPISRPQAQHVVARPVDTAVMGIQDDGINALVTGLASFNPALNNFLTQQQYQKDVGEVQKGKTDAALKRDQMSDSEMYAHGYLKTKGANAAAEDMAELQGYMAQNYNPDTDDFQGTVKGWLAQKTSANTDKSFLEGYAPGMDAGINKMANSYTLERQEKLKQDLNATQLQNLMLGMKDYIDRGEPVPEEYLEAKKGEFAQAFKTSGTEFNALQFQAAKTFGDQGHFGVYEQFKKNRPDGTPGMYFIPAWKEKIDIAEAHSKQQFLSMSKASEVAAKKDREGRQEKALSGVFVKALTGEYSDAVTNFKQMVAENPNLFLPSEISEWTGKLSGLSKMSQLEETRDMQITATNLLARIYSGRASMKDVLDASTKQQISYAQSQQLIQDVNTYQTSQRQLSLQAQALETSIFKTNEFKSTEDWLAHSLDRQPGMLDQMSPENRQFLKQVQASALLEYNQKARTATPGELIGIAQELVTRYSKQLPTGFGGGEQRVPNEGLLRYRTATELRAAFRAGKITAEEAQFQGGILEQKLKQSQGNSTNGTK